MAYGYALAGSSWMPCRRRKGDVPGVVVRPASPHDTLRLPQCDIDGCAFSAGSASSARRRCPVMEIRRRLTSSESGSHSAAALT